MATLTFDALWRDKGVAKGLGVIAGEAIKAKLSLDKLGTSGGGVFRRLAGQSAQAARAGNSIGNGLRSGIMRPLGGLPGIIAGLVGGSIVMGAKRLATEASDMNETVSKTRTIFGASSKSIESWARGAAKNLGMSRLEALNGASAFGNLFDQLGFGAIEATKMSKGFVRMATDAASFNNANPAEVMEAFQAATRGEYDALQKYIPTASAATIQAEAMRMTHKKSVGDLTAADKAAALYQVSVKGLGKAHGDFDRTSGGFANQQRIMAANWADLRVKIGQQFLPMFTKAAVYMNTEGFPALTRIVDVLGELGKSAGRMGTAVFRAFSSTFGAAIDRATLNLTELADWMETHQEAGVRFFLRLGYGAIGLGKAIVALAVRAVRSFGDIAGSMGETVRTVGNGIASLMDGAAKLLPPWDKSRKLLLQGAADIRTGANTAADGLGRTKTKAHEAADEMEKRAKPAFDKAGKALGEVGRKEIWAAKQRDAAAKARIAIRDIGTAADGSAIKLKTWADRTKLGADAQKALEGRVRAARNALRDKLTTMAENGAGQAKLTRAWEKGRDALAREFRQMGLSRAEARRLAAQYAGIPPKVTTRVTQPGMRGKDGALAGTKDLDTRINHLNGKKVHIGFSTNAREAARALGISVKNYENIGGGIGSVSRSQVGTGHGPAEGGPTVSRDIETQVDKLPRNNRRFTGDAPGAITKIATASGEGLQGAGLKQLNKDVAAKKARDAATITDFPGQRPDQRQSVGRGWGPIMRAMRRHGANRFTTYRGHHPSMARARDVTPHNWRMANAAKALSSVWYVIYRMRIASKNRGNNWRPYTPIRRTGDFRHVRHIHVARYDGGGMVPPGGMALNTSGRAERMLAPRDSINFERLVSAMDRRGGRGVGNTTIVINAPNYVGSTADLRRTLVQMAGRNELDVVLRRAGVAA